MESVARAEGDVDALIAIIAANLDDQGRSHLRIARELDGACAAMRHSAGQSGACATRRIRISNSSSI